MQILIVDDHRLFLEGVISIVSTLPDKPETFAYSSARMAIDMLDQTDQEFDLALVDLYLPGLDGLGFLQSLKYRGLKIPTLVISATTNENDIAQALKLGAQGFVPKHCSADELRSSITRVLSGELVLPVEMNHHEMALSIVKENALTEHRGTIVGRQLEVLQLIAQGYPNKSIAQVLGISEPTVKTHISGLFKALGVSNRTACAKKGKERGLID